MSKMIQIRHVPETVHRVLKARAAEAGMTLSEYLLREVTRSAGRPTAEERFERIHGRKRPRLSETTAAAVRAEREGRG